MRVRVELVLTGTSLDHSRLSMLVGRPPDRTWNVGDGPAYSIVRYPYAGWVISSGWQSTSDLSAIVSQFLSEIEPYGTSVTRARRMLELDAELSIVAHDATANPGFVISAAELGAIAELELDLDVDIYCTE